jgi:hypothetical protein
LDHGRRQERGDRLAGFIKGRGARKAWVQAVS